MTSSDDLNTHSASPAWRVRLAPAAVLAAGVLAAAVAGPAHAERPDVSRPTCVAAGGVFKSQGGTRTCTVTTTSTVTGPAVTSSAQEVRPRCAYHRSCATQLVEHTFTGTSQRSTTVQTVTVSSQRGTRPAATRTITSVLSTSIEPLACTAKPALDPSYGPLTVEACAERGLFTA